MRTLLIGLRSRLVPHLRLQLLEEVLDQQGLTGSAMNTGLQNRGLQVRVLIPGSLPDNAHPREHRVPPRVITEHIMIEIEHCRE